MKKYLLKNGNKPYDLAIHPLCGAKTRLGQSCRAKAMQNGRCRIHGGKSTGAKTQEGMKRICEAKTKHGRYLKEVREVKEKCKKIIKGRKGKTIF